MKHIDNLVSMFPQQLNLDPIIFCGLGYGKKNCPKKLIHKLFDPSSFQKNKNLNIKISKPLQIEKTAKSECTIQIFSTDQINSHLITLID